MMTSEFNSNSDVVDCWAVTAPCPPSSDLVSRGNGLNMGGPDQVNDINKSYHQDICLKLEIQKNG